MLHATVKCDRIPEMGTRSHFLLFHEMSFLAVIPIIVSLKINMPANQWIMCLLERY